MKYIKYENILKLDPKYFPVYDITEFTVNYTSDNLEDCINFIPLLACKIKYNI